MLLGRLERSDLADLELPFRVQCRDNRGVADSLVVDAIYLCTGLAQSPTELMLQFIPGMSYDPTRFSLVDKPRKKGPPTPEEIRHEAIRGNFYTRQLAGIF